MSGLLDSGKINIVKALNSRSLSNLRISSCMCDHIVTMTMTTVRTVKLSDPIVVVVQWRNIRFNADTFLFYNKYRTANHVKTLNSLKKHKCCLLNQLYEYKLLTIIYCTGCSIINSEGLCFHDCLQRMLDAVSEFNVYSKFYILCAQQTRSQNQYTPVFYIWHKQFTFTKQLLKTVLSSILLTWNTRKIKTLFTQCY